jgi:hypothetical protein
METYYVVPENPENNPSFVNLIGEGEVDLAVKHIKIKGSNESVPSWELNERQFKLLRFKRPGIPFRAFKLSGGRYVEITFDDLNPGSDLLETARKAKKSLSEVIRRKNKRSHMAVRWAGGGL